MESILINNNKQKDHLPQYLLQQKDSSHNNSVVKHEKKFIFKKKKTYLKINFKKIIQILIYHKLKDKFKISFYYFDLFIFHRF